VGVRTDGDNQAVSKGPGELKVLDVAGVNDVETAVAMNQSLPLAADGSTKFEQLGKIQDFVFGGHKETPMFNIGIGMK
jgi:hypothetical protein